MESSHDWLRTNKVTEAVEEGALPQDQCGERVRAIGAKIAQLRDRRTELADLLQAPIEQALSGDELHARAAELRDAITTGAGEEHKRLVQALVAEIRVHGRDHIIPVFKNPADFLAAQVRTLGGQCRRSRNSLVGGA